jgi:hypothetical protein
MKTAIKQLIERIEKQMSAIPNHPNLTERALYDSYLNCKNWATELLDKEKEQIINAHIEGQPLYSCQSEKAEQYYKQTYIK